MNDPNAPGGQPPDQQPPQAPSPPPAAPPPPPPPQGWQSTPQQPGPPPPGGGQPGGMPSWTSNITASNTLPGPGGTALATIGNRIVAIIIDAIILGVINLVIGAVIGSVFYETSTSTVFGVEITTRSPSIIGVLVTVAIAIAINAGYFIYMWTRMNGATVGMRVLNLRVVDGASGGPVTQQQAINRWLLLGGPQALSAFYIWGFLGTLISLAVLVYYIYLLITTAQSPTRQGLHDTYANTSVIKVA